MFECDIAVRAAEVNNSSRYNTIAVGAIMCIICTLLTLVLLTLRVDDLARSGPRGNVTASEQGVGGAHTSYKPPETYHHEPAHKESRSADIHKMEEGSPDIAPTPTGSERRLEQVHYNVLHCLPFLVQPDSSFHPPGFVTVRMIQAPAMRLFTIQRPTRPLNSRFRSHLLLSNADSEVTSEGILTHL
eukprot:TRINITY_DN678_c1_g1_i6.p1 TRINITY_DN678_c1_g1~~TRINITY_DN678_c1_g1_i6.p1  ORF type:complete len:187 (-),score=6.16 TRINITY_DN678_c1_g1_i6:80-640(-)